MAVEQRDKDWAHETVQLWRRITILDLRDGPPSNEDFEELEKQVADMLCHARSRGFAEGQEEKP
jgi:hypothetical protein